MKNFRNFLLAYRTPLMAIVVALIVILSVTALQEMRNVTLGVILAGGAIISFFILDFFLPEEVIEATASRSISEPPEQRPSYGNILAVLAYAGSFILGMGVFFLSEEEPAPGFLPGPWGTVAVIITIGGPIIFHVTYKFRKPKN